MESARRRCAEALKPMPLSLLDEAEEARSSSVVSPGEGGSFEGWCRQSQMSLMVFVVLHVQ